MSYQEALETYINATNTHDFDRVQECLHKDAVYWFTNATCTTPAEIRAFLKMPGIQLRKKSIWQKTWNGW